jgi:hypothetical protein
LTLIGELLAALLLVMPKSRTAGALLASLIWTVYLALILRAIAQGRPEVDCGCSFAAARHSLGSFEVSRNAVLLGFAALIAGVSAQSGQALIQGSMALRPLRGGEVI